MLNVREITEKLNRLNANAEFEFVQYCINSWIFYRNISRESIKLPPGYRWYDENSIVGRGGMIIKIIPMTKKAIE